MKNSELEIRKGTAQIFNRTDPGISFKNAVKSSNYDPLRFTHLQSESPTIPGQHNIAVHPVRFSEKPPYSKDAKYSTNHQETNYSDHNNRTSSQNADMNNREIEKLNSRCSELINENQKLKKDNAILKSELATKASDISGYTKKIRELTQEKSNLKLDGDNLISNINKLKALHQTDEEMILELKENINAAESELSMLKAAYVRKTIGIKHEINKIANEFNIILSSKCNKMDEILHRKEDDFQHIKNILMDKFKKFEKSFVDSQNDLFGSIVISDEGLIDNSNNQKNDEDYNTEERTKKEYELFDQLKDIKTKIHSIEEVLQGRSDLNESKKKELRIMMQFLDNEKNEVLQNVKSN